MIDTCNWNSPGDDPYSGTARAAIMAYAQIPKATRIALVARAEAATPDYDDIVFVDRESIRGRREYYPDISSMHFGGKGRLCGSVTRSNWDDKHVESAIVFCADGWCVARFSVCNNWSIIRLADRRPETLIGALDEPEPFVPLSLPGVPAETPLTPVAPPIAETYAPPVYFGGSYGGGYYGGGGFIGGGSVPCDCVPPPSTVCPPPVIPAVPETSSWLLLVCGLALLNYWKRRQRS